MNILLAPEKLITSTTKETWDGFTNIILFTSRSDEYTKFLGGWPQDIFSHIEMFDQYATNDTIELMLIEYSKKYKISNIIPMTEADVLRAALVKEKLGIDGLSYTQAIKFRDKIVMKEIAKEFGIKIPRFKRIRHTLDLLDFVKEVSYPIIIKPILGRGSLNTICISNEAELRKLLNTGFISNTSRYSDLLAEEYIEAQIYHIDGLQINHKIRTISVSKYVNNCLSFVGGSYLGSYTLDVNNPLRNELIEFSCNLMNAAFVLDKNALFHIEVFIDKNGKISLCEIACRMGGNGINDEVMLQQGNDIKMDFIRAECGIGCDSKTESATYPVSGRLLIPPKEAQLVSIPNTCNIDGVIKYQARGKKGNCYKKMLMSNDEIANFLIAAKDEVEINDKISKLASWFNNQVIWSN